MTTVTSAALPDSLGSERSTARLPREERRLQLLTAAREVFVAQGYHTTGMDDIAERAGVSKPVLYQHFPGKLDLYLALLDEGIAALLETLRSAMASTTDNRQRVQAAVTGYFAFVDNPDSPYRLVFESDLTHDPRVRERVERADDECAGLFSRVIAADTGLSDEQAHLLAAGLLGMAHVAARRWLRDRDSIDLEVAADLISSLGWRGISGFPLSHPPEVVG
jgi:AcrR family transcriptional regulator